MEFLDLFQRINRSKIRYLVVGGIAVNLHGIIRPTNDIDLVVYLERKNLIRFVNLMRQLGYKPTLPVRAEELIDPKKRSDWSRNRNMVVFSFHHQKDPMKGIDVFIKHPLPFGSIYKRKEEIRAGEIKIPVIGIPDLIKLKRRVGRLQDRSDIRALREILRIRKESHEKKSSKKNGF